MCFNQINECLTHWLRHEGKHQMHPVEIHVCPHEEADGLQ